MLQVVEFLKIALILICFFCDTCIDTNILRVWRCIYPVYVVQGIFFLSLWFELCYPLCCICSINMLKDEVVSNALFCLQEHRLMYAKILWMCWFEQIIGCSMWQLWCYMHLWYYLIEAMSVWQFCKQDYRGIHPPTCLCEWMELRRWEDKMRNVHRVKPFWCIRILKQAMKTHNLGNSTYELFSGNVLVNMF